MAVFVRFVGRGVSEHYGNSPPPFSHKLKANGGSNLVMDFFGNAFLSSLLVV